MSVAIALTGCGGGQAVRAISEAGQKAREIRAAEDEAAHKVGKEVGEQALQSAGQQPPDLDLGKPSRRRKPTSAGDVEVRQVPLRPPDDLSTRRKPGKLPIDLP